MWLIAITVMLPTFIEIMDISIVNVSLDHIRGSLSAGLNESTWVITSYLVSNAIIIPMSGWLSRLMGRKRYLISSVILFTLSSLLCGAAWNLESLIFFRILQGIGGGGLQPISQSILLETFPPEKHGKAMAFFGMGVVFAPVLGPVLGGIISDNWTWRWIFFINIPTGILSVLMIMSFIHDPHYMKRIKMKIDYLGLGLLALGIGALQIVLDKGQQENWFDSGFITVLCAISVVSVLAFIIREFFVEHPILDLRAFKNLSFTTGNIMMFFAFLSFFSGIVLIPIFLQTLLGYNATLAGLILAPGGIATIMVMPFVGRFVTKWNPKFLLALGVGISAYAAWLLSGINLNADFQYLALLRIILGFGIGFFFVPLTTLTLSTISREKMGNASAIYNFLRNLGGSFGVAIVTTILARRAQIHQARLVEGMTSFDRAYQMASEGAANVLHQAGDPIARYRGLGMIYRQLVRQAAMLSFNDAFYVTFVIMAATLPLIFFMKRGNLNIKTDVH
jgi:DHA2 family multidrug resistance protein